MGSEGVYHPALRFFRQEPGTGRALTSCVYVYWQEQRAPLAENLPVPFRLDSARNCSGRRTLPPPNGYNVHIHSESLRPFSTNQTPSTTDDLEESVGSISGGGGLQYDDLSDDTAEEEHTSGVCSGDSFSPVSPFKREARHNYVQSGRTHEDYPLDEKLRPDRQLKEDDCHGSDNVDDLSFKPRQAYEDEWDQQDVSYGAQGAGDFYREEAYRGDINGGVTRHPEWDREDGLFEDNLNNRQPDAFIDAGRSNAGQSFDCLTEVIRIPILLRLR